MATYTLKNRNLNNLERGTNSLVFNMATEEKHKEGDVIYLGDIPNGILMTSMVVLVDISDAQQSQGARFTLGIAIFDSTDKALVIDTWDSFKADLKGVHRLSLPNDNNIDNLGDPYAGTDFFVWEKNSNDVTRGIAVELTQLPNGIVDGASFQVVINYRYINNTGDYIS